ncbi:hypothetical protein AU196_12300 [Mycobacterium sp. IS-1742]|uniref:DUF6779 domain-containing protein n=1 Tax=Mycobacterium sp. IS-1742 TaxID=1772285 RepID=UPI0007404FD2|nr:DUF6779 domain-containing protein [Mycobacterium sp. IS-1742]KUI33079.1 hypothetical protein AU196_12300 [Mycobacterium sp. IS-1742]
MTVLPRGPRARRGNRRPGWMLLTVLLVLAILASSALVFTNRVELLKLAVILALWAAVAAAFVSVIYRRQSDHDQAKARDLKLVYDLQLDREISARREYELTVETQLRRELANELQAQAADEVAALRAELAALRTNLEILFDADLAHRPAIEHDRTTVRAYSDWAPDAETTGRVSSSRLDDMLRDADADESESRTEESPIIDVPAEPQPPEPEPAPAFGGAHRRPSEAEPQSEEQPRRRRRRAEEAPPPTPPTPEPTPEPDLEPETDPGISRLSEVPASWERPTPPQAPEPEPAPAAGWQPAPAEGQWIPAGAPGSHWVAPAAEEPPSEYVGRRRAQEPPVTPPQPEPRRGKHSAPGDDGETDAAAPAVGPVQGPQETAEEAHARRRRSLEDTGGQSVAELLARLQANPTGGGRRRREP